MGGGGGSERPPYFMRSMPTSRAKGLWSYYFRAQALFIRHSHALVPSEETSSEAGNYSCVFVL